MTTAASDVDLDNRLRLTFGDQGDPRLNDLTTRLTSITELCGAATWLTAYASGVPVSPAYGLMVRAPMTSQRHMRSWEKRYLADPRVAIWPPVLFGAPGWAIPRVARLTKQSPMVIDLVFDAIPTITAGGGVTALLIAALKNPEAIGGWLPSVATSWHSGRAKAIHARLEASKAQARSEMYWEQDSPDPDWVVTDGRGRQYEMLSRELNSRDVSGVTEHELFAQLDRDRDDQFDVVSRDARHLRTGGLSLVQDEPVE